MPTSPLKRRKPQARHRRGGLEPTHEERIKSLERRMTAVEATLSGKLDRVDQKLENIGEGLRTMVDCNSNIVRSLQDIRTDRGMPIDERMQEARDRGDEWVARQEKT